MTQTTTNPQKKSLKLPLTLLSAGNILALLGLVLSIISAYIAGFDYLNNDSLIINIAGFGSAAIIFSSCSFILFLDSKQRK
ncbi:MAG: hypothetical protein ACFFD4_36495 [Candidatus Odinarchaeota archaeon]